MEDRLMEHLEFFGLPGSGKSTVSHSLAEKLKRKGRNIGEPTFSVDHKSPKVLRPVKKFFLLMLFSLKHRKETATIKSIVKDNGYKGFKALKQTGNIAYKLGIILKKDDGKTLIWDEGLIQSAISLSSGSDKDVNENISALLSLAGDKGSFRFFYIKTDVEFAISRLKERKGSESRAEKISDESVMKKVLDKTNSLCEAVNISPLKTFSAADGSEVIAETIAAEFGGDN